MAQGAAVKTEALRVSGVVQGVGFRPYVARLARKHALSGSVRNLGGEVYIRVRGEEKAVSRFLKELTAKPPAGSFIRAVERVDLAEPVSCADGLDGFTADGFTIEASEPKENAAMPGPDIAVCGDCLRELFTPGDSRFHNPFISCTYCGPRFSILKELPYDRARTSMGPFPMCEPCGQDYHAEEDRRFHAQTVCCNACGPRLVGRSRDGRRQDGERALKTAAEILNSGGIAAIKGIGGYHLACCAADEKAVSRLRALKGRECKPFAVLFQKLADIKECCAVSKEEEALLLSPARPIVLLHRTREGAIAKGVYGSSRYTGAFLPYTPLQHLLFEQTGPLVLTSANPSGLPIFHRDEDMLAFFEAHAELDYVLFHDRAIERMLDDSVVAVVNGNTQFIRRARGYVPLPAAQMEDRGHTVLALGPHQKSSVCVCNGGQFYPSTELGDLTTREMIAAYQETAADMRRLLQASPTRAVCDLHPDYASTQYAKTLGLPLYEVQHHFAHVASVLAEHGKTGPVIGVAFDGTGYGTDGTVWGGEFLLASPFGFYRAGHIRPIAYLGGDASIPQGWKSAACLLHDAGLPAEDARGGMVEAALKQNVNVIRSSSMGRVFDAASSLLGVCRESTYEGQCAIELEAAAAGYAGEAKPLAYTISEQEGKLIADLAPAIRELVTERDRGVPGEALARRFHAAVAALIREVCVKLRERTGVNDVALSGGVFHNRILLTEAAELLAGAGFHVFTNRAVPPGDGGISLGQAYIGACWASEPGRRAAGRGGEWKEEEAKCALRFRES
ncbi:MAG TPA: carbamoyltransferase HypF [Feifaniaceae bacterium]|nr:carbamoyltransferase HypF [Feifaniaceae bacterium]